MKIIIKGEGVTPNPEEKEKDLSGKADSIIVTNGSSVNITSSVNYSNTQPKYDEYQSILENVADFVANTWRIDNQPPASDDISDVVNNYKASGDKRQQLIEYGNKVSEVYASIRDKAVQIAEGTYIRAIDLNMLLSALLFGAGGAGIGYFADRPGKGAIIGAVVGALIRLNGARISRNKRINALADEAGRQVESLIQTYLTKLSNQ